MNGEEDGNNFEVPDEEFIRIRSTLYRSVTAQIEKICKRALNVADNMAVIESNLKETEEQILNVIEVTDFLVSQPSSAPDETLETTSEQ